MKRFTVFYRVLETQDEDSRTVSASSPQDAQQIVMNDLYPRKIVIKKTKVRK